jgi:hypothetical protein
MLLRFTASQFQTVIAIKLIAVNQLVTDKVDELRVQLDNEIAIKALRKGKSRSRTVQSLPRYIGIALRRRTTPKSWSMHFPALNHSSSRLW